jgi:hypothetical protein
VKPGIRAYLTALAKACAEAAENRAVLCLLVAVLRLAPATNAELGKTGTMR